MQSLSPYSAGAMDLGLATQARAQAQEAQERLRKKKQLDDAAAKSITPAAFSGGFMSLTGNQF